MGVNKIKKKYYKYFWLCMVKLSHKYPSLPLFIFIVIFIVRGFWVVRFIVTVDWFVCQLLFRLPTLLNVVRECRIIFVRGTLFGIVFRGTLFVSVVRGTLFGSVVRGTLFGIVVRGTLFVSIVRGTLFVSLVVGGFSPSFFVSIWEALF